MKSPYDYYITPDEYERAERNGICASTLRSRIYDFCWRKERAINTPPIKDHLWREVKDIALSNGVAKNTFKKRIELGWSLNRAITQRPMNSKETVEILEQKKKRVFTDEQIQQAEENGISYRLLYDRVRRQKWELEVAITTPVLTRSECAKRGKGASYWNRLRRYS